MSVYKSSLKRISIEEWGYGGKDDVVTIFDTNVLSYMLYPDAAKQIKERMLSFTVKATENGHIPHLAISAASIFECMQGNEDSKYEKFLEDFICFEVNLNVQYVAAKIKKYLQMKGKKVNDIPDLYISATSILTCGAILTANESDFPSEIFKEVTTFYIQYKTGPRTRGVTLYLLRPEYATLANTLLKILP